MEIKIRNLDDNIVAKLDELARKKGLSRNEYLRKELRLLALEPELRQRDDQYSQILKETLTTIKQNTEILSELIGD